MNPESDIRHMQHALRLAERGLGTTAPNPSVGCVIVDRDGRTVGRGWTQKGGRPHAEAVALEAAGERACGATAYVSLEPCAHHGKTPPCADALIAAGIDRVVAAVEDPDPRVRGLGLARLRNAGIAVECGLCAREASELNAGFFLLVTAGRPLVTLKIAQSVDGRIATSSGESRWITGPAARAYGHYLRARHDAILVGIGTVLADDPLLTCRVAGLDARSPLRAVLDTRLRMNQWSQLAQTARDVPTVVYTVMPDNGPLAATGVEIVTVARDGRGRPDVLAVLKDLAKRGTTRLLVEGGASVHASFIDRGLADRLEIFTAPILLGASGLASVDALAALELKEARRFRRTTLRRFGSDVLESFAVEA